MIISGSNYGHTQCIQGEVDMVHLLCRRGAGGTAIHPMVLSHLPLHAGEVNKIYLAQAQLAAEFVAV